jgi:hypothetical protein
LFVASSSERRKQSGEQRDLVDRDLRSLRKMAL